jgi:hypothetical protein
MKILSIGNSFSVNAHRGLYPLAVANGVDVHLGNLFIGGCSLQLHWENIQADAQAYSYRVNGEKEGRPMSIAEALVLEQWDVVTLQQASRVSGRPQSYIPYLTDIANVVRKAQPQAKLYFHQTWAYEVDFNERYELDWFDAYQRDQEEMFRRIKDSSEMAAKLLGVELLRVGEVIQTLRREFTQFDYPNGGVSLTSDKLHLSSDYGEFAAGATWLYTLFGQQAAVDKLSGLGMDNALLNDIVAVVTRIVDK